MKIDEAVAAILAAGLDGGWPGSETRGEARPEERPFSAAEGHPAAVMDMSFATQALMAEWVVKNRSSLRVEVMPVPREVEQWIARLKLSTMGVAIDELTPEQRKYLEGWEEGT